MSSRSNQPVRWIAVRSVLHWDFWSALAVSALVATVALTLEFNPERSWVTPLVWLSLGVLTASLQQWASLRSKLSDSAYGELVRIVDESEIEIKMPYQVTISAALVSVVCSVLAMIFIEAVNLRWVQALFLAVTSMFAMWSFLALVSLIRLSLKHDRNIAEVESTREKTEAAQRLRAADQRGRAGSVPPSSAG